MLGLPRIISQLAQSRQVVDEISLSNGQSLFGVRILGLYWNAVLVEETGSPGAGRVFIDLEDIVTIDPAG